MRIKQIFFDCDNTLVDTEIAAVEVCADLVNKVMEDQNIAQRYSVEEVIIDFYGKTARQMIVELGKVHGYALNDKQKTDYALLEEDLIIQRILAYPEPCPGIQGILHTSTIEPDYQLALVSSSPIRRIRAALESAGIAKYFKPEHVYSAKNSMPEPKSKPDPAIYRWAMKENGVVPDECIAFEDSRSGAGSAINADIATIAYVGAYAIMTHREHVARILMAAGCKVVMEDWRQFKHYFYKVVAELDEDSVAPVVGTSLQDSLIDNKTGETFQLKLPEKAHEAMQIKQQSHWRMMHQR